MIIVVDSNIIFSGLLNSEGTISDLLLNSQEIFHFYSPSFLLDEIEKHQSKILKASRISIEELNFLKLLIFKNIIFIDLENIKNENWKKAIELTEGIDEFDAPFIALALELNGKLWTGDKKLTKGLANKGIDWIQSTSDILAIRNKL